MSTDILSVPGHFVKALTHALKAPLPGTIAQKEMSPPHGIDNPGQGSKTRISAVLLLMYPTPHGIVMPFTLRLSTLAHHAGEICFPGGGLEDQDPSLTVTALRETSEELGLDASFVHILGALTPLYVAASHNMVHPMVGWMKKRPDFKPSPAEVDRIIEVPLQTLLDPQNIGEYYRNKHGQVIISPCYRINSDCIWGATAMILSEFISILRTHILS